eukprot:3551512-Alexandrium_andersonii.AAC.1
MESRPCCWTGLHGRSKPHGIRRGCPDQAASGHRCHTALRRRRRVRGEREQAAGVVEAGPEARGALGRHLGADGPVRSHTAPRRVGQALEQHPHPGVVAGIHAGA